MSVEYDATAELTSSSSLSVGVPRQSEWRLYWPILIACTFGMMLCTLHVYTLGVMVAPLEEEFGWTRTQIFTGPLILAVTGLFGAPLVGAFVDRIGARKIALVGVPTFCGSLALLSLATASPPVWWMLWFVVSATSLLCGPTIWAKGLNSRFVKNRGLAMAIALSGTGMGGAFIPALTEMFVEWLGWREAYLALAALAALIAWPLIFFLFRSPADSIERQRETATHHTLSRPNRVYLSPGFLKLAFAMLIFSFPVSGMIVNTVPILISNGFGRASAAQLAGLIGIGAIIGRLCGGYLLDHLDANRVSAITVLLPVATGSLLIAMPGSPMGAATALFILGLSVGTEFDACSYLTAQHFGMRNFGKLYGIIMGILVCGNGLAPLLVSFIYDRTASYLPLMWAVIPTSAVACFLLLWLGPPPPLPDEPTH